MSRSWKDAWGFARRVESAMTKAEAHALWALGVKCEGWAVEIGAYKGRSTIVLGIAVERAGGHLASVDPHQPWNGCGGPVPASWDAFRAHLGAAGLDRSVEVHRTTSAQAARAWPEGRSVDLLWIDGDHSYKGASLDWRSWSPLLSPGAIVAWHDYTRQDFGVHRVVDRLLGTGALERVDLVESLMVTRAR